jgi:hypothetical protein
VASGIIKKVMVKKASLPPVGKMNDYYVRYRIVSDDKNRTSAWSQIHIVESDPISTVRGSINVSTNKVTTTVTWGDELDRPGYDIFATFGYDIFGKSITSNVATIKVTGTVGTYVGDEIYVTGMDSIFNGTHIVTSTSNDVDDSDNPITIVSFALTHADIAETATVGNLEPDFFYHGTSKIHFYSFLNPIGATYLKAIVQIEGQSLNGSETTANRLNSKKLSSHLQIFPDPNGPVEPTVI